MNAASPGLQTGHIGLNVTSLARSASFYQEVFGFQVLASSDADGKKFAFLGDGEKLVLTLWEQSAGQFNRHQPGLHHLSFQVGSIQEVRQMLGRLKAKQVKLIYDDIVPHAEGSQSGGVFFEDPDGIRLEIFSPTGAGEHQAPSDGPSCGFF